MSYEESYQLYNLARESISSGDIKNAISLLSESNKLYLHFKTLELLGGCNIKLRNFDEAIHNLEAAVGLNNHVKPRSLLAKAYEEAGNKVKAVEIAKIILLETPNNKIAKGIIGE